MFWVDFHILIGKFSSNYLKEANNEFAVMNINNLSLNISLPYTLELQVLHHPIHEAPSDELW